MKHARAESRGDAARRRNEVFDSLSAEPRRRLVVSLLDAPDRSVPLPEEATSDADRDHGTLRTELRHNHLPRMAAAGFVEWDTDPLVARQGPRFDGVAAVVEALRGAGEPWPEPSAVGSRRRGEGPG